MSAEDEITDGPAQALFIDDREVARRTGLARVTLQIWRTQAKGPPFYKLGRRVLYSWPEVESWIRSQRVGG